VLFRLLTFASEDFLPDCRVYVNRFVYIFIVLNIITDNYGIKIFILLYRNRKNTYRRIFCYLFSYAAIGEFAASATGGHYNQVNMLLWYEL
jgi:hypothetical protein